MSDNSTQDFLNNIPAPASTKNEAANDAVRTFRQQTDKAGPPPLTDAVATVARTAVAYLSNHRARLGAAYINCGKKISLRIRHFL